MSYGILSLANWIKSWFQKENRKRVFSLKVKSSFSHIPQILKQGYFYIFFKKKKNVSASLKHKCWIFGLPFEMHLLRGMTKIILNGHKAHLLWSQEQYDIVNRDAEEGKNSQVWAQHHLLHPAGVDLTLLEHCWDVDSGYPLPWWPLDSSFGWVMFCFVLNFGLY